ncbi:hypothetical protein F5141DRAFT_1068348 [Pisolithus sp. B1]|nr:hypothetical protein F5141DRAFT_1068348 [Pisolithus sp. B1]
MAHATCSAAAQEWEQPAVPHPKQPIKKRKCVSLTSNNDHPPLKQHNFKNGIKEEQAADNDEQPTGRKVVTHVTVTVMPLSPSTGSRDLIFTFHALEFLTQLLYVMCKVSVDFSLMDFVGHLGCISSGVDDSKPFPIHIDSFSIVLVLLLVLDVSKGLFDPFLASWPSNLTWHIHIDIVPVLDAFRALIWCSGLDGMISDSSLVGGSEDAVYITQDSLWQELIYTHYMHQNIRHYNVGIT